MNVLKMEVVSLPREDYTTVFKCYLCIKVNLINNDEYGGCPFAFMYCIFCISCKIYCSIADDQLLI